MPAHANRSVRRATPREETRAERDDEDRASDASGEPYRTRDVGDVDRASVAEFTAMLGATGVHVRPAEAHPECARGGGLDDRLLRFPLAA